MKPEPADPPIADYESRAELSLAPSTVDVDRLPEPLRDGGEPLSVGEARDSYGKLESWNSNREDTDYPPKHKQHLRLFARIMEADRLLQERFSGYQTTVMLTRRLSPLDSQDNWLTPWELCEMLLGGGISRSVRQAINYHLGSYDFEYVAVTSGTRKAATPHEHIYLWVDDPNDTIEPEMLRAALERHTERCANAYEKDHAVRADGNGGAITVRHETESYDKKPDNLKEILEGETPNYPNTRGAYYVASQLPHLPASGIGGSEKPEPTNAELDAGVTAWLSPHRWFKSSGGFPT